MLDITSNGKLAPIQPRQYSRGMERNGGILGLIDIIDVGGHPEFRLINVVDDGVEKNVSWSGEE